MMDWKTRIPVLVLWLALVLSSLGDGNAENQRVVCYYTNWSVYRPGTAKFSPQNINPYLCTHLIYAFGGFTKDNTLKPFDKYQDIEKGGYAKFTGLKTYNKNLKTMLAIGGWNEASSRFSPMVADPGRRKEFVKNSVKFLRQNHFDGLDLDWEYPAFRDGGKPRDKNNYADLVQELREEFERESSKTGRPRLLLSMAVPAGIEYIDKGYDVPRLNDHLDFINLLSYDYHSAYEPAANHHAPLYPLEEENEYNYDSELTIDYTIGHLLKSGASSEKIVLGIPTYGRSYTLFNEDATDIGAPADGPGEEGDATREKGYLAYYEICESIGKSDEWEVVQPNPSAMGPYAFRGNQWVGYDDEDIVRAKARYVNEKKLGGIMFWSIDNDDFRGKCHGRPYPLIEAAKEAMLADDEKSVSGTKTKFSENRKKTRPTRIQGNAISRKLNPANNRRSTTTESTRRRISTTKSKVRSNGRINGRRSDNNHANDDDDDDDMDEEEEEEEEEEINAVKAVEKTRPRIRSKTRTRNRSAAGGRRKQQQNSRRNDVEKKTDLSGEESSSKKFTTPEPPTTPDPGSDFKCEDEGFFSHPRDCKKYFWCLDSGPGGLGIVAHQFTCPSGLVFNKAADSCDYPRNVVCPKTKSSQPGVTTTRAPITAATSRTTYLHKSTQRTTTEKIESEEEYEYYDDEEIIDEDEEIEEETRKKTTTPKTLQYKTINRSRPTTTTLPPITTTAETKTAPSTRSYKPTTERIPSFEDEEDPRVLKELIDLIRKAGGIEQLEKQLHYQEKNSGGNSGTTEENGRSTPATISRSLYERVLNRQATRIAGGFLGSFSTTQSSKDEKNEQGGEKNSRVGFVNGPGGAQFEGLDNIPEVKSLRRTNKPKYVTIERPRQSTSESPAEDDEDNTDVASSEDRAVSDPPTRKKSNRRVTPSYVNIRRPRPSTTTNENDVDVKNEDTNSEESEDKVEVEGVEEEEEEKEEPVTQLHRVIKTEEESTGPKSRYTNVQRFRSTTSRNNEDDFSAEVSVKNVSTTSTWTKTERVVPVTEAIEESQNPNQVESTSVSSSTTSFETLSTEISNLSSSTTSEESSLEESSIVPIVESTTSDDSSLRLVENSATEILFTTVPASSGSTGISSSSSSSSSSSPESFTREPANPVVSQPRPFGFPRRGRPTTSSTTASSPASASSVGSSATEQTRTKVDMETLRLPTLKELVGIMTTPLNQDSTSVFNPSSTTTFDRDHLENHKFDSKNLNNREYTVMNLSDSGDDLEPSREREIFDNDILGSEEIQRRSSSGSLFVNGERQLSSLRNDEIDDMEKFEKSSLRGVEVPVKILNETNGDELVLVLRVPGEYTKLNASFRNPILRVRILEPEEKKNHGYSKNVEPTASSENKLLDDFRPASAGRRRKINLPIVTYGNTEESSSENRVISGNRPRNRQRIVKARRRTRPDSPLNEDILRDREKVSNGRVQDVERVYSKPDKSEKSTINTRTVVPEFLEQSSTTVRATTIRGNFSTTFKSSSSSSSSASSSNESRGFYVTRRSDETLSLPNSVVTDSPFHHSTLRTDSTKPENMDFTDEINLSYESTTEEIITKIPNNIDSTGGVELTTVKLETVMPDFIISTIDDRLNESFDPLTTTLPLMEEKFIVDEPSIILTTLRPWTRRRVANTSDLTNMMESTREYSSDDGRIETTTDTYTMSNTDDESTETPKTAETNVKIFQATSTIATVETTFDQDNITEFETKLFHVENTTESLKAFSDANKTTEFQMERFSIIVKGKTTETNFDESNIETKSQRESSEMKSSTVPMIRMFDQTERSLKTKTTNHDEKATTYRGVLNRGRTRFTSSTKTSPSPSIISVVSPSSVARNQTQTTNSFNHNNLTNQQILELESTSSTEAYDDKTLKNTEKFENSTSSSSQARIIKTTEPFIEIDKTLAIKKESTTDMFISTEAYDEKTIDQQQTTNTVEANYLSTNFPEESPSSSQYNKLSSQKVLLAKEDTSTEFVEKSTDESTTEADYVTWKFVETTGSESFLPAEVSPTIESSFDKDDSTINGITVKPLAPTVIDIDEDNYLNRNKSTQVNYPKRDSFERANFYTTVPDEINERRSSLNTLVIIKDKIEREADNLTVSRDYSDIPKSSINFQQEKFSSIDHHKNESSNVTNDATTYMKLESLPSTTSSYSSTPHDHDIFTSDLSMKINHQTVPASDSTESIEIITSITTSSPASVDEKYVLTSEPNKQFYFTTLSISRIDEKLENTTVEEIETTTTTKTARQLIISKSDVNILNEKKSNTTTTTIDDSSKKFPTPIIEGQTKRDRGRVRFTNFAPSTDLTAQKPVKQVVVRRRLAITNRHRQDNISSEAGALAKSINNVKIENTKKSRDPVMKDRHRKNSTNSEINAKNNNLNVQAPDEKILSSNATRRRVVVYRGRPRAGEIIVTTPSSTTKTMQISSLSNSDEDQTRNRRKWRKKLVRKRARIDENGEDDQIIAETGDLFRRALIDDKHHLTDEFHDELGAGVFSPLSVPDSFEIFNSTELEDTNEEVNMYKSSGAFLRRPGTLVRTTDVLGRSRPKTPSTLLPSNVLPASQPPIFSRITSADPTDERKTEDQSLRAQELAVTLADPPAIRPSTSTIPGRPGLRKTGTWRKISTTVAPQSESTVTTGRSTPIPRRRQSRPNNARTSGVDVVTSRPTRPAIIDYDYYVDEEVRLVLKPELKDKLYVTRKGGIRCLDQGNFAHPTSCKKFITCARMVNGQVIGTEYTCPEKLSFDPVGEICNWSAGLGCEDTPNNPFN